MRSREHPLPDEPIPGPVPGVGVPYRNGNTGTPLEPPCSGTPREHLGNRRNNPHQTLAVDPTPRSRNKSLAPPARAAGEVLEPASGTGLRAASRRAPAPLSRDADAQREGWHVWPPLRTVALWAATAWRVACGSHPDACRRRRPHTAPAPSKSGGHIPESVTGSDNSSSVKSQTTHSTRDTLSWNYRIPGTPEFPSKRESRSSDPVFWTHRLGLEKGAA